MTRPSTSKLALQAKVRLMKWVAHTRYVLLANAPVAMSSLSTSEKYGFAAFSLGVVSINLLSGVVLWLVVKAKL